MRQQRYSNSDNSNDSFSGRPGRTEGSDYRTSSDRPNRGERSSNQQDWYNQDPMDERSGYRSESSRPYSSRNEDYGSRSVNDREFDRYAQRSPSNWGSGQSYSYNQTPDYGSSSHSGEDYYGSSRADRSGSERYSQERNYGTSYGYSNSPSSDRSDRSYERPYERNEYGRQGSSFRPHNPLPRAYGSDQDSYSSRMDYGLA